MHPDDSFRSIREATSAQLNVKGSRFLAEAFPVADEEAVDSRVAEIRRREHAATHHCSAYRLGPDGARFRYNDDGEPSGTAGLPILRQIEARELTNTLVVVTRYYGGTKLGTGGLARAYGEASSAALDASKFAKHVISERVNVSFEYGDTSPATQTIEKYAVEVLESTYTDKTEMTIAVPRSRVQQFLDAFTDALGGRGRASVT